MNLSPIQLLREAIKAVPALKYALGVVGLVAVVAIVGAFRIRPEIAVFGAITTLVLMVALLVFAKLTKSAKRHFLTPALVLMWSFLVLVIAAAGLLFTSTFFDWPIKFSRIPHSTRARESGQVEATLKAAQLQLSAKDYEGAWKALQGAAAVDPDSTALLDAQVDVAMVWLRNLVVREPQTFTEIVDQLTVPLYKVLVKAKGGRAGDICAHIGWAFFLRSRENPSTVDIAGEFRKAIAHDPQNPYGHAMLAHHLLQHAGNVAEARRHFDAALAAKRDYEWVREMQIAGLRWMDDAGHKLELARVANEMRKNGEVLSPDTRDDLFSGLYWFGADFSYLTNLVRALPAAEHLATLEWLAGEEGWKKSWPKQKFVLAALKEQTGNWAAALELYQHLGNFDADFDQEVKQAIVRCKVHAGGN